MSATDSTTAEQTIIPPRRDRGQRPEAPVGDAERTEPLILDGTTGAEVRTPARRRSAFVDPETVRLDLPEWGFWIEVAKKLAFGPRKRMLNAGMRALRANAPGEPMSVEADFSVFDLVKLGMRLEEWNLTDADGRFVPISDEAIDALEPDLGQAMIEVIDAFDEQLALDEGHPKNAPRATRSERLKSG
jgi:hypothetical protein